MEDHGLSMACQKAALYLISPFFETRVYRIYGLDIGSSKLPSPAKQSKFTFKALQADEDDLIAQIEAMEEWLSGQIASKLSHNSICIVALDGRNVAGFNLVCFREVYLPLLSTMRVLEPGEAWSEQISVHKDYRRMGLASQLRYHMFQALAERGIKHFYGGTLRTNIPSLKLARKVGFTELEDIRYVKLLFVKRWYTTPIETPQAFSHHVADKQPG